MSETPDKFEQLHDLLSDHFDACVLVGYDLQTKKRVQINNFANTMQRDALQTLLQDALQDFTPPQEVIATFEQDEE